jgi:hypothetical protein
MLNTALTSILRRERFRNDRWLDNRSLDESWDERPKLMVRNIQPGSRVVDVGAGSQAVRSELSPDCTYIPIDIVRRTPDTITCDLNREDPPDLMADYVVASGLLEYISDVPPLIQWMVSVAPHVTLSYETGEGETRSYRRRRGWINHYTQEELLAILNNSQLNIVESARWRHQTIYWLMRI